VDLDDAETAKLLALHDPLAAMAQTDRQSLATLLDQVETDNDTVRAMLDAMLDAPDTSLSTEPEPLDAPDLPEAFQVVGQCRVEAEQQSVYERLTGEGFACRLLTM
ncbi:MAG: hypothetical protein ABFC54_07160, partial [Thermoguttaceae bacterium]